MRFSNSVMDEYDILNLPLDRFREYLDSLKRRYEEHMRMQEEEDMHSQMMDSEVADNSQEMAPNERQELVDEGFIED